MVIIIAFIYSQNLNLNLQTGFTKRVSGPSQIERKYRCKIRCLCLVFMSKHRYLRSLHDKKICTKFGLILLMQSYQIFYLRENLYLWFQIRTEWHTGFTGTRWRRLPSKTSSWRCSLMKWTPSECRGVFFFFETKAFNCVEYLLTPSWKQDCFTFNAHFIPLFYSGLAH